MRNTQVILRNIGMLVDYLPKNQNQKYEPKKTIKQVSQCEKKCECTILFFI